MRKLNVDKKKVDTEWNVQSALSPLMFTGINDIFTRNQLEIFNFYLQNLSLNLILFMTTTNSKSKFAISFPFNHQKSTHLDIFRQNKIQIVNHNLASEWVKFPFIWASPFPVGN